MSLRAVSAACLLAFAMSGVIRALERAPQAEPRLHAGMSSPSLRGTALSGQHEDLKAYTGKVVVLDFWASWCAPCLQRMPALVRWQRQFGPRGLQILGIAMDDDAAAAKQVARRVQVNYPVLMGTPAMADDFQVLGLPHVVLLGRDGTVVGLYNGDEKPDKLLRQIEQLVCHTGRKLNVPR